jgi:hypothetical protein
MKCLSVLTQFVCFFFKQVNYHPSLVWTEIMSFIKGSFASLTKRKGFLDKDSYQQLGRKQAPNFTGSRDKVRERERVGWWWWWWWWWW